MWRKIPQTNNLIVKISNAKTSLKIKREHVNSLHFTVTEDNNSEVLYEIKNTMSFMAEAVIFFFILFGITINVFPFALILDIGIKTGQIAPLAIVAIIYILILGLIVSILTQSAINKFKSRTIESEQGDKEVGLITVKGWSQNKWFLSTTQEKKIYSMIFSDTLKGQLKTKKDLFGFSVQDTKGFEVEAYAKGQGVTMKILAGPEYEEKFSQVNLYGSKEFTVEASEGIEKRVMVFFATVLISQLQNIERFKLKKQILKN